MAPTLKSCSVENIFFWITIVILLLVNTFVGFQPYDDEGYFLLTTQKIVSGQYNYQEIIAPYGPLYYWFTNAFGQLFKISHLNFRILQFLSYLTIVYLSQKIGKEIGLSKIPTMLGSIFWVLCCSGCLNESFHPGWIITILVNLNCLILTKIYKNRSYSSKYYFLIGICVALISLLKPHIGILNLLAVILITIPENAKHKPLKIAILLFSFLIFFIITKNLFSFPPNLNTVYTFFPFALMIALITSYSFKNKKYPCNKIDLNPLFNIITSYGTLMILAASACCVLYNPLVLVQNLLYPSKNFSFYYRAARDFNIIALVICILIFYLLVSYKKYSETKNFKIQSIIFCAILALITPHIFNYSINYIAVITFTLYFYFRNELDNSYKNIKIDLLVILSFNYFHTYPLDMIHLVYVTPLFFILLFSYLKIDESKRSVLVVSVLASFLAITTISTQIYRSNSIFGNSINNHWVSDFENQVLENETKNIAQFISGNSNLNDKVVTLGCYPTINILSERDSPGSLVFASYNYFSEDKQLEVIADLITTKYAVLYKTSLRFKQEIDREKHAPHKNLVYKNIIENFEEIPIENWNKQLTSIHFSLLINPKFKSEDAPTKKIF